MRFTGDGGRRRPIPDEWCTLHISMAKCSRMRTLHVTRGSDPVRVLGVFGYGYGNMLAPVRRSEATYGSPAGYRGRGQTNGGPNAVSCEIVTRSRAPTHASKVQECMCKQQNNMWAFRGAVNHCIWRSWRRAVAGTVDLQLGTIGVAVSNSNLNL